MFEVTSQTKLPRLSPDLKLVKGSHDEDGAPTWRLYHPVSHQYFQIGWVEFEYLSRFSLCRTYGELEENLKQQTTLEPDENIFQELLLFLNQHGLLADDQDLPLKPPEKKERALLAELVHKYLFFSVPLVRPQNFLKATYPYTSVLFSREMTFFAGLALLIAAIITLGRIDEFFHTFLDMFSMEGALMIAVTFTVIKLFHELGHAYTAYKHGLNVPHMGIAFMVMYPVFYTETTSAWHLMSRKEKIDIGLAGIRMELILAAIFLFIWNYTAPGVLNSIAFSVVAISLVGSLFINLNPLMRFDGYFILSDLLAIENMHSRSFACARWWLRKTLFGWKDEAPEQAHSSKLSFFIAFGWATLIYRFFLFTGIAILVYVLFPKPLGLVLMVVELLWFIIRPVASEIAVWIKRYSDLVRFWQGKVTALFAALFIVSLFLPIQNYVAAPALYHASNYRDVYAPYPAKILSMSIIESNTVSEGEVLITLESPELEKDLQLARVELEELQKIKRRQQTNPDLMRENIDQIKSRIENLKITIRSYEDKQEQLKVKAPFNGQIKDVNLYLHEGRYIGQDELLFRIINMQQNTVTAYITDNELARIQEGDVGIFHSAYAVFSSIPVTVELINPTNVRSLDKEELSSVYGGPIYSEVFQEVNETRIVPRQSLYKITLSTGEHSEVLATPGYAKIYGQSEAPIKLFFTWLHSIILPESDVI